MRSILVQVTDSNDEQHEKIAERERDFQRGPPPTRRTRAALISLDFVL
jgi:hypothetical protein